MQTKNVVFLGLIFLFGAIVGCQTTQVGQSGFLSNYSDLRASADVPGARFYQNKRNPINGYDKFMVEQVAVHFAPNSDGTSIVPDELDRITDYFHEELVSALSENYRVVRRPGPGVLKIRIAITSITRTIPAMNIHIATKMSGVGLGGAAMEAEAVDSVTGERIMAISDSQQGSRMGITTGLRTFGHAKQVIDRWIARFLSRINRAHGQA